MNELPQCPYNEAVSCAQALPYPHDDTCNGCETLAVAFSEKDEEIKELKRDNSRLTSGILTPEEFRNIMVFVNANLSAMGDESPWEYVKKDLDDLDLVRDAMGVYMRMYH